MAPGNKTYKGLAVPLNGESEIFQITAATDILTITGATSQAGDYLNLRQVGGTEDFSFTKDGTLVLKAKGATAGAAFGKIRFPLLASAPTSAAGIKQGDVWMAKATTDVYRFALAISDTVATVVRYGPRMTRTTLGSVSS
jgi:hypothetical protein